MVRIVGIAAAGWYQTRNATAVKDAHAFWLGWLAGPVQTVLGTLMEDLLVTCPASVSSIPTTLIIANVVTACALPHFSVVEWLERTSDAALVMIRSRATFAIDVTE